MHVYTYTWPYVCFFANDLPYAHCVRVCVVCAMSACVCMNMEVGAEP